LLDADGRGNEEFGLYLYLMARPFSTNAVFRQLGRQRGHVYETNPATKKNGKSQRGKAIS
jgi:hypothetical protein